MSNAALLIAVLVVFGVLGPLLLGCLTSRGAGEKGKWKDFLERVVPHINGPGVADNGKKVWVAESGHVYVGAEGYRINDFGYSSTGEWFIAASRYEFDRITLRGNFKN